MYLGLDFGSSGARACVIDDQECILHADHCLYPQAGLQTAEDWRTALHELLSRLPAQLAARLQRIVIDGTSSSVLLCDAELQPLSPVLLYNDNRSLAQVQQLQVLAPRGHTVLSPSSGLAKFLWLTQHGELAQAAHFMHQADWLAALLTGYGGTSDYHNALKSGYDTEQLNWPAWVRQLPHAELLPHVLQPGELIAEINSSIARHFNINPACTIHAGTTDSIAAFIAAGATQAGEAVTSLGTTMVLKLLSPTRVEAAQFGIYSHRYGHLWLVGGASNAGGGVLKQFFSDAQLVELSQQINTGVDSTLDYYPLPRKGERFPHNDPDYMPRLAPRPPDDAQFLHGLLQGLSRIEAEGYALLSRLSGTALRSVATAGGGANNTSWLRIRERLLKVPVNTAQYTDAAYGSALLARRTTIIH